MTEGHDIYREEILEHYRHPMNFGVLKKSTHSAWAANTLCGDHLTLQLRIDSKGIIKDVAFEATGCALSIASASLFSEWIRAKNIKRVQKIGESQILKLIEAPIGPARLHCVLLSFTALQRAFPQTGRRKR